MKLSKLPLLSSIFVLTHLLDKVSSFPYEDIFGRSVGDNCKAKEGTGTCQDTSNCKGISYPIGLCPNDPNDVQCCVTISCNADGGSGYCRSVKNNGCPSGKFHPETSAPYPCPGDDDIQCCIKESEDTGGSCTADGGTGICRSVSKDGCAGGSFHPGTSAPWPCPGDNDIQCCIESSPGGGDTGGSCKADGGTGICRSVSKDGCPNGSFHPGTSAPYPCPGNDDIQCCISGSATPPPTGSSVGAKVLAKAKTAAGVPYAWGGGSCSGPSHDAPPWQYGDIGFDCSGLVCWALCQVTGRDLFSAGLRNTKAMYCASEATLGYKKYPFSERKAGDAVFFGGACSCAENSKSIHHVGLVMADGSNEMWNAPDDDVNKVCELPFSYVSSAPCPYVIRFTG